MNTIDDAGRRRLNLPNVPDLQQEIARLQDQLAEQKEISVGLRCDNELLRIQFTQYQDQLAAAREAHDWLYWQIEMRLSEAEERKQFYNRDHFDLDWDRFGEKLAAIPTSDRERRLEEARACKHGTWTIGLICVDCGQSRGKPDWTWYYDMVTF